MLPSYRKWQLLSTTATQKVDTARAMYEFVVRTGYCEKACRCTGIPHMWTNLDRGVEEEQELAAILNEPLLLCIWLDFKGMHDAGEA